MITVSQLVGRENCAVELHGLNIWDMDVEDVMPAHLQGFFYRSKLLTSREVAKNCANYIAEAIQDAYLDQVIRNNRLEKFSISEPPYLSRDLRVSLERMSMPARRCVYFSLLMGWKLENSVLLTWDAVQQLAKQGYMNNHDAAMDVLDSLPRHFKSRLVFWEQTNAIEPQPLVDLKQEVELAFDCSYEELMSKFNSMVLVDPAICAEELKTIWRVK